MPWMWIVAGPNGSGKTTLAETGFIQDHIGERTVWLDPDVLADELRRAGHTPEEASLTAARTVDSEVDRLIGERRSFLIETVLSTKKFEARVERARTLGFRIGLTFVVLADPDLSIERVRQRTEQGGHSVPPDKVRSRWAKSIANLEVFAPLADVVHVFDNSTLDGPVLIAEKGDRGWLWHAPGRIRAVDDVLRALPLSGL